MLHFSRWQSAAILLVVLLGIVMTLPNFFSRETVESWPSWMPKRQLVLGLDLQGGAYLLYEVDREDYVQKRLRTLVSDVRRAMLEDPRIGYTGLGIQGDGVQLRIRDPAQIELARTRLEALRNPLSSSLLGGSAVNEFDLSISPDGLARLTYSPAGLSQRVRGIVQQSIEVIARRVDELGTTEPSIQRQGEDRILVEAPGLGDPARLKAIVGQTALLTFHLVESTVGPGQPATPGPNSIVVPSAEDPGISYILTEAPLMTGEDLVDAQAGFNQQTNEPIVSFRLSGGGGRKFGEVTQQNVGRLFAIVLDDKVISAPQIREPILGGSGQISGSFTVETANNLAILLRAGSLPAKLTIVEERTIGPSLGADSIRAGVIASIVATVAIVVFMIVCYGILGVFANIALIANNFLMIGVLTALGATLTLPGIAGIVLTMGMAVDANVLIYERMREEAKAGRSAVSALDAGFSKAYATIIDSHLTALIAAIALFWLGSGPIRGFAITLAIGIISTLFTAYLVTRLIVSYWVRATRPKTVPAFPVRLIPDGTKFPFMKWARIRTPISLALIVLSFVLFFTVGVNQGIDFKGGIVVEVEAHNGPADLGSIRSTVDSLGFGDIQIQNIGDDSTVLIRIAAQPGGEAAQQAVVDKVRGALGTENYEYRRVEVVGPRVSSELASTGTLAVIFTIIGIMAYIWFRFEWQFAIGAVATLVHDAILMVGFFAATQIDFNLSSIAAILTVIGYSLNDTVVIFDRIREILRRYKQMPISDVIDLATNETLARTIMTSITLLLALGSLYVFGGEVIRSFTASMIWGVIVATASSIFIGGPILIYFNIRPSTVATPAETNSAAKA